MHSLRHQCLFARYAVRAMSEASLVERLRALAEEWYECCGDIHLPLREAADELERLTAYIKQWAEDDAERDAQFQELERVLESLQNKWASRPIDHPNGEALARENEQLRAALERIAANEYGPPCDCNSIAREALALASGEKP